MNACVAVMRGLRSFRSSADVRAAIPMTSERFAKIAAIDCVVDRLRASGFARERSPALAPVQAA